MAVAVFGYCCPIWILGKVWWLWVPSRESFCRSAGGRGNGDGLEARPHESRLGQKLGAWVLHQEAESPGSGPLVGWWPSESRKGLEVVPVIGIGVGGQATESRLLQE